MNIKFKEFAEQCWDLRLDGKRYFDQEMFAELIVRECARVGDSGDPLQDGGIAKMIKRHFEVD
jgi:hypothetical protein